MGKIKTGDKHKDKLMDVIEKEVTSFFEQVLNYTEVAVPNRDQHSRLRAKILRLGNDCIRNISKHVAAEYLVEFVSNSETIIEISNGRSSGTEKRR